MRHNKRYETYIGAKMTETLIESFLPFSTKALSMVVRLKDIKALKNELKNDYIITKELSALSGSLALKCGRMLAAANTFLIAAKHVNFSTEELHHSSRFIGWDLLQMQRDQKPFNQKNQPVKTMPLAPPRSPVDAVLRASTLAPKRKGIRYMDGKNKLYYGVKS